MACEAEASHFLRSLRWFCKHKNFPTLVFLIWICPMAQSCLTNNEQNQLLPIAKAKTQLLK